MTSNIFSYTLPISTSDHFSESNRMELCNCLILKSLQQAVQY